MPGFGSAIFNFHKGMSEELNLPQNGTKEEVYQSLFPQLQALLEDESDIVANMANLAAALKEAFNFFWVGFYIVKDEQLVLGPFQGPIACTRINFGRGVCGTSWKEKRTIIVPDVEQFPGHIACSSLSKSEIVVPLFKNNEVVAVLDVDSEFLNHFDEIDAKYLSEIAVLIKF